MRGEIAVILAVLSIVVIGIGTAIGFQSVGSIQNPLSLAGEQCSYKTFVHVYSEEKGWLFSSSKFNNLRAVNNRNQSLTLDENGQTRAQYVTNNLVFDPSRRTAYAENDPASVRLVGLDSSKYKVKEVFCDQKRGSERGCPLPIEMNNLNREIGAGSDDGLTIGSFRVNCGVDLTYGWILTEIEDLSPSPSEPPEPTENPEPSREPSQGPRPPGNQTGSMEVRVVALNYPQKTPHFDEDSEANFKPASCKRQGRGETKRPLYLSTFEIKADCVGGGCQVGKRYSAKANKREGFINLKDMQAGEYELKIGKVSDRGYHIWDGCESKRWTVQAGKNNTEAIVILENESDGVYEHKTTEKLCKDKNGEPNLIEEFPGFENVCYLGKEGEQPEPEPEPQPEPEPDPPAPPDVSDSDIWVRLSNKTGNVQQAVVRLDPCPSHGLCEQTVNMGGGSDSNYDIGFNVNPHHRYEVKIDRVQLSSGASVQALDNAKIIARRCSNGYARIIDSNYETCVIWPKSHVRLNIYGISGSNPVPDPDPPQRPEPIPDPGGGDYEGSCYVPKLNNGLESNCAPQNLASHFGDLGRTVLRQAAAICYLESGKGNTRAHNRRCLNTGRNCLDANDNWQGPSNNCNTFDWSVGLFQHNTVTTCVKPHFSTLADYKANRRTGQPACSLKPTTDQCTESLFVPDINIREARNKYNSRGWQPWSWTSRHCGYR